MIGCGGAWSGKRVWPALWALWWLWWQARRHVARGSRRAVLVRVGGLVRAAIGAARTVARATIGAAVENLSSQPGFSTACGQPVDCAIFRPGGDSEPQFSLSVATRFVIGSDVNYSG